MHSKVMSGLEREIDNSLNEKIRGEFIEIALRKNLLIWKVHWADAIRWTKVLTEWKEDFTMVDLRDRALVYDSRHPDLAKLEDIVEDRIRDAKVAADVTPKSWMIQI